MAIIKTLFSTKELAEYTGYSIHSIYYMIKNNTIPYYKPNRKVFFKKDDIDNWIDSEKVMSKKEIEDLASDFVNSKNN